MERCVGLAVVSMAVLCVCLCVCVYMHAWVRQVKRVCD